MVELILGALIPSKVNSLEKSGVLKAVGEKSTIKLGKNSLKGTSKDLVIRVSSKADKKAVKKQLKKAGNPKAKVKIME